MRALLTVSCIIAGVCLAGVAEAEAQSQQVSDEEARSLFEAGRLALQAGRFEEAYGHFSRAYELSPRPLLLYNMGVTADRLHRYEDARTAFQRFLESSPDTENRAEVERRIQILDESIAREAALAASSPATAGASASTSPPASSSSAGGGGGFPLLFTWIPAGLALVAGGLAIGFWVAANDGYASLEDTCGAMGCTDAQIDESGVDTNVTLTNVFFVSSLVLVGITGAVLGLELALAGGGSETASLRVGPGSLALTGTFR